MVDAKPKLQQMGPCLRHLQLFSLSLLKEQRTWSEVHPTWQLAAGLGLAPSVMRPSDASAISRAIDLLEALAGIHIEPTIILGHPSHLAEERGGSDVDALEQSLWAHQMLLCRLVGVRPRLEQPLEAYSATVYSYLTCSFCYVCT
jgi:hypothetical protein